MNNGIQIMYSREMEEIAEEVVKEMNGEFDIEKMQKLVEEKKKAYKQKMAIKRIVGMLEEQIAERAEEVINEKMTEIIDAKVKNEISKIVLNMLKNGASVEQISLLTDIPQKEVEDVKNQLCK